MKHKIILSLLVMIMAFGSTYASFPVKRTTTAITEIATDVNEDVALESPAASAVAGDSYIISILLWLLLGGLAAHRWYLGSPIGWNILFILTFGGLGIWWLVDGIQLITDTW